MKSLKPLALCCTLLVANTVAWSQSKTGSLNHTTSHFRLDVLAGMSPGSNQNTSGILVNRQSITTEFLLNMYKTKPQLYVGLKAHFDLAAPFFVEAGTVYTQKEYMYSMKYTYDPEPRDAKNMTMKETEKQLLIPLSIGVSLGAFDVISGFTVMSSLSKKTELSHIQGFRSEPNNIQMGWHTGVRHTFKRAMIGIEYDGSFSRVGQGSYVNGQSLELPNIPGRFVATIQYSF